MNEKLYAMLDTIRTTALQAGDTAASVAYAVGKQADAALSAAKLNLRILERKNDVKAVFQELGEMLYATHTGSPSDSDALLEKLQSIDTMKAEIAQMEVQTGRAVVVHACPACGREARDGDRYCRFCGGKL